MQFWDIYKLACGGGLEELNAYKPSTHDKGKPKMEMHLVLLEIAREDLKAADFLLEKKLYRHSIFFLQQSIEKLLKSLGIWMKIISITEAETDIKHLGHGIYVKLLKKFSNLEIPDAAIPILEKEGHGKDYVTKLKLRADELRTLLSSYSPVKALNSTLSSNDLLSDMLVLIQGEMQEMRKDRLELLEQSERLSGKNVEESRRLVDVVVPDREHSFCQGALIALSLVFSAHEAPTRYPRADFNPLEAYVESTPLVQMLGPFIEITREICGSLGDVYAKMKR